MIKYTHLIIEMKINIRDSASGIITEFSQERQSLYRVNHEAYEVIIAEKKVFYKIEKGGL